MSFWDFVGKITPALITGGMTLYGAKKAEEANKSAAQTASQASRDATDAEMRYLDMAQRNVETNRAAASPALMATNNIISRGTSLTPDQVRAVEDSREQALNALSGSSLRGSAKATSAVVSDVDRRVRDNFLEQNRQNADATARAMAGQYFGAGNTMANLNSRQGSALSSGLLNQGNIQAASTLGQGALRGQAIGDVGAIVADTLKNDIFNKRESMYNESGTVA